MKYDIVIVGAGASGLVAAYQAICKNPQLNILVLEKENIVGRKLNASGNGKCNLTNSDFQAECYHSSHREGMEAWVTQHSCTEVISFFEEMGILLYEKNGYYYPISNQAKQVSTLLYNKGKVMGVEYRFHTKLTSICPIKKGSDYQLTVLGEDNREIQIEATYVIISVGGFAASKLGGCKDGYKFCKQLGLQYNDIYPVLSPIYMTDKNLSMAKGVRLDANVTLKINDTEVRKEVGQIQFNDNNLSGIVMMNLSCYWNAYRGRNVTATLCVDVLPQYTWDMLKSFFVTQRERFGQESTEDMLKGILPVAFVSYIVKRLGMDKAARIDSLTDKQLNRLTSILKKLEFYPVYVEDFEKAQATGGGIALDEIDIHTFESKKYPNLFLIGEVLDVHGKCGGYNLTFAVISGIQAANEIVDRKELV